jgi:hypothetical protein
VTEAELQSAVIELARLLGYRVAHFRPAQTVKGWRTAVEADGKGFPDLVLVRRPARLLFVELKAARGRLHPDQQAWLELLGPAAEVYVWTPAEWSDGTVELVLRGLG